MGNYQTLYQDYYSTALKRRNGSDLSRRNRGQVRFLSRDFFIRRAIVDLSGVFILLTFIVACRFIKMPELTKAYNYAKYIVNYNYDYKSVYENIKKFDFKSLPNKANEMMNQINNYLNFKKMDI